METKTDYRIQLEKLLTKASADTITVMSKRLWKLQLIIDLCAVTKYFEEELVKIEGCYNLYIDKDVDYEEWASNEKWKPLHDVLHSRSKDRYNSEGQNIASEILTLAAEYIKVPSDEEISKAQNDNTEYKRLLEKKEKRENYRQLLFKLDSNEEITDEELDAAVLQALSGLQNVLKKISNKLNSSNKANEKRVALYDELHRKFLPEGFIPMWDAHKVWNEWKEGYYGDSPEEGMKEFVMIKLLELLDSGFVICDRDHDSLNSRNKIKSEIEEYLNDKINDGEERKEAMRKYSFLRCLLEYKDGFYEIKEKEKIGKYIYEKRHFLSDDMIKTFFGFLGLNIIVKDEVAKQKGEQNEVEEKVPDGVTICNGIPKDCSEAVQEVIISTFTIERGVVLQSATQIRKAAELIDCTKPFQVAMLMAIGKEVKAVRSACTCPEFVRALIGMKVITYTDNKEIDKLADGMRKKLNGYTTNGKKHPALPDRHQQWDTNDQKIGKQLYDAIKEETKH